MNPKKEAQTTHAIATLSFIMVDKLDEFRKHSNKELTKEVVEVIDACNTLQKHCETMLNEVFGIQSISNGTYLNGLSEKLDTIIRKNFENIK